MTKARIREMRAAQPRQDVGELAPMLEECLDEIERLQSFTRRGDKPKAEKLAPAAKVKAEKKTDPRIAEFIGQNDEKKQFGWMLSYHQRFGEKYLVQGVKDAMAVKRLLTIADVETLLDTAWEAWQPSNITKFNCKQSVTIIGFASRYNDIVVELKSTKVTAKAPAGASL